MEVDTDDDLLESRHNIGSRGPPPDVTTNLPSNNFQKTDESKKNKSKPSTAMAKLNRNGEYQPLLNDIASNISDNESTEFAHFSCNHFESDPEFNEKVKNVEYAIDHNVLPQRIYEGSSGSYFCKNANSVNFHFNN